MVVFLKYYLANGFDARQYYESIIFSARETGVSLKWKRLNELFAARFSSVTKQIEVSNRLE